MAKSEKAMRSTLAVTLLIFVSKAIGFIRESIMAAYYGTGASMDAYNAAYGLFYLPVLLFSSCITSTLVPMYIQSRAGGIEKRANHFASNALTLFALYALLVTALMTLFAAPLTRLVYPGFTQDKQLLTTRLLRIMLPSLVFFVVSIVMSSLLNARERFLSAQLTGFPLSLALILATVAFSSRYGVEAVAWGVIAAGVLQVVVQYPALHKVFRYTPYINPKERRFRKLLTLAVPAIFSMSIYELNHLIDRSLSSGLADGSMSAMNFAYKLISFMLGVLLVPLVTVMFSKMSQKAVRHDKKGVAAIVTQSIEVVCLVVLPIVAVSAAFSEDVIRLAYMRGRFDAASLEITASVFVFYVIGLIGFGLRDLMNRAFHALQDTITPMIVAVGCVVLNVALNLILIRVMGANGLALATSISGLLGAFALAFRLRSLLGLFGGRRMTLELAKIGLATAVCLLVALALKRALPEAHDFASALGRFLAAVFVSGAAYGVVAFLLRVRQLSKLRALLRRRTRGAAAPK